LIKTPDKDVDQVNGGCETINVAKVKALNEKMKLLEHQRGTEDDQSKTMILNGINDKRGK
jgi:hypothetical protein